MRLKDAFEAYLIHVQKYRAKGTHLYYRKNYKTLNPILDSLGYLEAADIDDHFFERIIDYLLANTEKKNSKINDMISSVITALNFSGIKFPRRFKLKNDTESFKALSEDELDALLKYIGKLDLKRSNNLAWSLAIRLFLDTGVRFSEILDLKFEDVDFKLEMIRLRHTKNNERRIVFYNVLSRDLLMMAKRKKKDYVLWNYVTDQKLNQRSLEHFFEKLNDHLKLDQRIHAHRLRKTFATRMLWKGCPLTTISKLLGHKDIRQTMIYLEIDQVILSRDYQEFYPF